MVKSVLNNRYIVKMLEKYFKGEDFFISEIVDLEMEGDDNLGGEDKKEIFEEVVVDVLVEVIIVVVRVVDGEGVFVVESNGELVEGEGFMDIVEVSSDF